MSSLIVILPTDAAGASAQIDYVLSTDSRSAPSQGRVVPALLPQPGNAAEVVALVPARALSWHLLELPPGTLSKSWFSDGATPRLRTVIEGLLEERLLDDPAQLHFALAPDARAGTPVWVAVCDRAWLRASLQTLEQAGRTVARIVPEFAPDAPTPALYVIGDEPMARIVSTGRNGVTVLPLGSAGVALANWPAEAEIVAEPGLAAQAEQLFQRRVTLQLNAQRWLQSAESAWDLAQFDLVNTSGSRTWKRVASGLRAMLSAPRWRAARWAAVLLVLAQFAGINAWAWKEQAAIQAKRAALGAMLTGTFPQVRLVVDPQQQMQSELAALRQATGAASERDLESMVAALASVVPGQQVLTGLDYVSGELRAKGLTLTPQEQGELSAQLQARGYQARTSGDTVVLKAGAKP